jgi:hypothetical protein
MEGYQEEFHTITAHVTTNRTADEPIKKIYFSVYACVTNTLL